MANATSPNSNRRQEQDQEEAPLQESCAMHRHEGGLQGFLGGHGDANVGDVERVVSVMGGGLLTVFGAARGGLTGLGLAILGGGMIYRGVTGHCEAYHSLGINTSEPAENPRASDHGHAHA